MNKLLVSSEGDLLASWTPFKLSRKNQMFALVEGLAPGVI